METSINILHKAESNVEEPKKKEIANKLFKPILVLLILSWITLMTSCAVSFGVPFYERHGEYRNHATYVGHGSYERHGGYFHHEHSDDHR